MPPRLRRSQESLRKRYRPTKIKILFIGESPPASGRFFYQADSGLYRAIHEAFLRAFPQMPQSDFLKSFQASCCFLIDLCPTPVDRLTTRARSRARRQAEPALATTLRQLRPAVIVTLLRSISPNVLRAQRQANWSGQHQVLPYPGRWHHHRAIFLRTLIPLLRRHYSQRNATKGSTRVARRAGM